MGAIGVAGIGTPPGRRALHQLGVLDAADRSIPDVDLEVFEAEQPGSSYRWRISRSRNRPEPPAFAIVCLHGRGATSRFAFESVGVHTFAAMEGLDVVVAAVDNGESTYWHSRRGAPDVDDLITTTVKNAQDVAGGAPVAVMGWSMGGYGALRAAAMLDDAPIDAVVAGSPAVWRRFADSAPGAFDDAADFRANTLFEDARIERLRAIPVRIDCGSDDPFEGVARDLLLELPDAEGGIGRGFHDAMFWRRVVVDQLRFLERSLTP